MLNRCISPGLNRATFLVGVRKWPASVSWGDFLSGKKKNHARRAKDSNTTQESKIDIRSLQMIPVGDSYFLKDSGPCVGLPIVRNGCSSLGKNKHELTADLWWYSVGNILLTLHNVLFVLSSSISITNETCRLKQRQSAQVMLIFFPSNPMFVTRFPSSHPVLVFSP